MVTTRTRRSARLAAAPVVAPAAAKGSKKRKTSAKAGTATPVKKQRGAAGSISPVKKVPLAMKQGLKGVAAPPAANRKSIAMAVGSVDSGVLKLYSTKPELKKTTLKMDARLVLVEPAKNSDKYYIIQLFTGGPKKKAYCYNRWGRSGTSGSSKLLEGDEEDMIAAFKSKFKEKTGVEYDDANTSRALRGKYEWLATVSAANKGGLDAVWEYYVDDGVDGKATGWYPYDDDAAVYVEELYNDFVVAKNSTMGVRFVSSGNWTYKVDLSNPKAIKQENTSTGKVRKIRRRVEGSKQEVKEEAEDEMEVEEEEESSGEMPDGTIPVDVVAARMVPKGTKVMGEHGVVLNQCNLGGGANNNKAYHIQMLRYPNGTIAVFTRWNRVGEEGKYKLDSFGKNEEKAFQEFCNKFKAKTANAWDDRKNFQKKNNKYDLLEMDHSPPSTPANKKGKNGAGKKAKKQVKVEPCGLDKTTAEFVEMIFSSDMFRNQMADLNLDVNKMPLGQLSQNQVESAHEALLDIEKELKRAAPRRTQLEQLSAKFYTLFPHNTGRTRPPIIQNETMLKEKLDLIAVVSDIEKAQEMLKDQDEESTKHPTDQKYDSLEIDLELLPKDDKMYKNVMQYYKATAKDRQWSRMNKLLNVWEASRKGEDKRYKAHDDIENRKLLWHGTNVAVVAAVCRTGLKIMPWSGGRVGKGIYLASEWSKSSGYTCGTRFNGKHRAVMFLVEAALGKERQIQLDDPSLKKAPKGHHSVLAQGTQSPVGVNDVVVKIEGRNVVIPLGKPKSTNIQSTFSQDEFLIYDESQHRIRYVLEFECN